MSGVRKSLAKVEISLRWDPSPVGTPANDLDILAAVYGTQDPYGEPVYVVHFGSRAPDGTITLNRDSRTGQGFGYDEVMTLELNRLAPELGRVVVGVVIQDAVIHDAGGGDRTKTFADIAGTGLRIREGHTDLAESDFTVVPGATAATVAEFTRDAEGGWTLDADVRGFDNDPEEFVRTMGALRA
ncbi:MULTISPECIES: TerD family protein [unclassified Streptomyces]|uniref:TerD family protein n=1 Tax=unclassified Streptomyces TaxID=2593676 RepID=UPI001BE641F4|nr:MULTISPECIES: TerD family protein [unclassified Streptomyces]MBT2405184.1 TerD family protein [Streptomyces sp. ISL-21]MBT2454761.1 TerD family protein [Streptomyces sp. ISL-86]MBT2610952.1 TerD family protein [Streptomyces sp. ISL-87]